MSQEYGSKHPGLEHFNQHLEFFFLWIENDQCLLNVINLLITVIHLANQFHYLLDRLEMTSLKQKFRKAH